eukprot:SAG31_NODE_23965_length_492_cov_0.809160_1_plen_28_part_01
MPLPTLVVALLQARLFDSLASALNLSAV